MRIAAICFLLLLLICDAPTQAKEQKNELMITAGVGSFQDIIEGVGNIGSVIVTLGLVNHETDMITPAIGVHYKHHISKFWSVGGTFNYQQFSNAYYILDVKIADSDINYYTFMGRLDLTYLRKPIFRMYSGLSAGLSAASESGAGVESDSEYWFAFQLNALGLRVGKQFAAMLEIGLGYNGLIAAGVSYQF